MKLSETYKSDLRTIYCIAGAVALLWTITILSFFLWNSAFERKHLFERAKNEALSFYKKDHAFRAWIASHGGVYVPVDENTPPNPYLSHVFERDIKTPSGRDLTLMNPAYVMRQVMGRFPDLYGVKGHMTSLKLLNPINEPDEWEISALNSFESGAVEAVEISTIDGEPYMRFMRPMLTKEACLKCHAYQGYKVGDVRGGVSLAVPFKPYLAIQQSTIRGLALSLGSIWISGIFAIGFITHIGKKRVVERSVASEALSSERERLAVILRSIGDCVISTDLDGKITTMNKAAEQLCGDSLETAVGEDFENVFPLIDEISHRSLFSFVEDAMDNGEMMYFRDSFILTSEGTRRIISVTGSPLRDSDSRTIGIVLVLRDVTETKRFEEEIRKAEKLESLGVLAGGIAHDFNNILTAISGNIGLLKMSPEDEDRIIEKLTEMDTAVGRAANLTQQLLTFSRGGAPVKQTASVSELIRETMDFALTGSNVNCEYSFSENLYPVEIDRGQISHVFHNLAVNASQAMPQGGTIQIDGENITSQESLSLLLASRKHIRIRVMDNGTGISPGDLNQIFDPFFTTKEHGSGLGLATSYAIIKKHGGLITVDSRLGEGTAFFIYLSASDGQPVPAEDSDTGIHPGKGKILLMDDDEYVLKTTQDVLTQLGYEVTTVPEGQMAVDEYVGALRSSRPFDVVILDLTIRGGMGGAETFSTLQEIDPGVKAIVASGYSSDPVMTNYAQVGFKGMIIKPYSIEELSLSLQNVMDEINS